jgi:hypothetical protein
VPWWWQLYRVESLLGRPLEEGYNPDVAAVRMTLEPMQYYHRPLFVVVGFRSAQALGQAVLTARGFQRYV